MEEVRDAIELEVPNILRSMGINKHDKTFTVPQARAEVYKDYLRKRQIKEIIHRSMQIAGDAKLRDRYYEKVNLELEKLEKDP